MTKPIKNIPFSCMVAYNDKGTIRTLIIAGLFDVYCHWLSTPTLESEIGDSPTIKCDSTRKATNPKSSK